MTGPVGVSVAVIVSADSPLPTASLGGTAHNIPIVEWEADYPGPKVTVQFMDNAHAVGYLREWAARLVALADEVES